MPPEADLPAAVLFDMDGTLIDSEGQWLQAEINVMERLGASWSPLDQAACLGGPLERVAQYMSERATLACTVEEIMESILAEMERSFRVTDLAWRPGARELLLDARVLGVPTALVSASWNRLIDAVSDKIHDDLGRDAFTVVVAGDDVTNSKPHPEPYERAAELLGVHTGECMALEDSPTGVLSAVTAGCRVVAIPHLAEIDPAGSFVIESLEGWTISSLWAAHALPARD